MQDRIRLAVDIGGTFTDLVLDNRGTSTSVKVLTTPEAPEQGVLTGVDQILAAAGVSPGSIDLIIHGTTLATNALIERKGAKTALITTEGFRDSLEIAYEHRFEQYDLEMRRPPPLVPRYWRYTVDERLAADGEVLIALDEDQLAERAAELVGAGIESVAICFLHSYANRAHEQRARDVLAACAPGLAITLSSDVCPEIREYERMSTACANAYVQPLMAGYIRRLESALQDRGCRCPLLLMMSSGGVTTVATAIKEPIRLVESGPAGGVILAQDIARELGIAQALSFDMGGTTAKLTLIDDFVPQYSRSFEVARQYRFLRGSGIPIRIPVIDMVEIGAGGGSIARVDELRRITVGPDSAGASPGPACYSNGGEAATVTDADVQLGRIDPTNFAGGKIALAPELAEAALNRLAAPLQMDATVAAAGVAEIVDETMASAARVHAVENGKDTAGRHLIATGGAAPLHAARLAEKLGIDNIVVPTGAGVGSAHGFLAAPIAYEVVRTRLVRIDAMEPIALNGLFDEMRSEALAVVRLGAPEEELAETREGFMRYRGQGHEITVALPNEPFTHDTTGTLRDRFEAQYSKIFGRIIPGLEIEALNWTLTLSTTRTGSRKAGDLPPLPAPVPQGTRSIFDSNTGSAEPCSIYERATLVPGMRVSGPAVIVEAETATVIPTRFEAAVSEPGHLILSRR